ncbi:hypothetical protein J45TS6_06940 [Paenibacillus sp. J45TS6]|uniref:DUF2164 domain-containing protein n=1 Tax=Paenibacillus polygoni TaxID=3050112 RepID=A0ABY8X1F1_9BACL|nr:MULTISPECIES: DUF2164 domain-containing protein [Paenibacillus]WIV18979.1 DUF2164 domain-containing protein [Paenibacillus polygoni]GIP42235.1 hypothetical protein J45TS6_06940 [Paenibacillus sp. J45TS6]
MKAMKLPKEQKDQMIRLIQAYFETERGETIGDLAADGVLDFFMTQLSPYVYNQALSDCRVLLNQRMISLEEDVYALEKSIKLSR